MTEQRTILTDLMIWDGVTAAETDTLILQGRQIETLCDKAALSQAELRTARSMAGMTALPGLMDAHVHVGSEAQARLALRSGVTTARSMGAAHYADVGLRELIRDGFAEGPEMFAAGYHVRPGPPEAFFRLAMAILPDQAASRTRSRSSGNTATRAAAPCSTG